MDAAARRDAGLLGRERALGAGRAASCSCAGSPSRTSATSAGSCRYLAADGANQEGAYWRYETAVRALESRLGSITGGNGAIYAVRREAYMRLDPRTSHDLSLPFNLVKRGWRAVYEPAAARRAAAAVGRGRVRAQAADDEPRLADRHARRDAGPARLRLPCTGSRSSRTACFATRRRCCTWSLSARTWRWSAEAGCTSLTLAAQLALLAGAALEPLTGGACACSRSATTTCW